MTDDPVKERALELVARIEEYAADKRAYGGWPPVREAITALIGSASDSLSEASASTGRSAP